MISEWNRHDLLVTRDRSEPLGSRYFAKVTRSAPSRRQTQADEYAGRVMPITAEIDRTGVTIVQGLADALNARRRSHPSTVRDVIL
ncbi:hypothetical protein HUE56_15145 [Azospirillum oryzae]|uniref:Uncharacterized protein n=1 Tax=Azospirillum oryzae TaxID=286727 RepID=A0A6N1AJ14_9PROT|nr:hypothetical protein [Azospirillum oryzae]KAA0589946.1 hypothetical protein FZ938_10145 [Azospirillum oryzae]QKS51785.1 hypothetical protein HUE56_15145 [Azospirillum oryzae]GLR81414.1 hypothetical protein GCM10007856_41000 [Azospirillum oryzae]